MESDMITRHTYTYTMIETAKDGSKSPLIAAAIGLGWAIAVGTIRANFPALIGSGDRHLTV
jgi:hypothetical protein